MKSKFSIDVIHDAQAGVFVGTSNDIPGLTIEESSMHDFLETVMNIVPYLLAQNLNITANNDGDVNVDIVIKGLPRTKQDLRQVNPIYSLHAEPYCAHATA